ncbi:MAG: UDP-N-acetylmuramoyl-tripeptide--D-alanyl-D-alanine ligase [Desulfobacterales bacterium]|nr:UDP-N-acetylmuramoyl-tripeptide--D-alanyl-D-alanine ligase [Desulfobacterales bacterium]MDD4393008.1 UDP-N-acetylmuramoyl-tripeptide--D-alanyl-D-alanine ligase [Desulfobacterales bacterium]
MTHIKLIPWTAEEILNASGGTLLCGDIRQRFSGVSIDSRRISADDVFVAIRGEVHDGHRFIRDILTPGVRRGIVVSRHETLDPGLDRLEQDRVVCIAVDDTTRALGDLAAFNLERTRAPVIAITGSCGKTTTREMAVSVFSGHVNTLSTQGNYNNLIGLPLTLLRLACQHELAILELGMNHPGEIRRLAQICQPDIGVIINIGPVHLEGLGSIEGVMRAKGELLEHIKPEGTAVFNADDPNVMRLAAAFNGQRLCFGMSPTADIRASSVNQDASCVSFVLELPGDRVPVTLDTPGLFMVSNALAAAAAGYARGLSAGDIKAGLEAFKPVRQRMNVFMANRQVHVIDDTYNANPRSMEAAIRTLESLKGKGRGILVAGDMRELGAQSEALHRKIGGVAAASGISRLYVTGDFAYAVAEGAQQAHMASGSIFIGSREAIEADLQKWLEPGDWVLIKGSRSIKMEKIVDGLRGMNSNAGRAS